MKHCILKLHLAGCGGVFKRSISKEWENAGAQGPAPNMLKTL
jgi:hypothetical protein